MKQKFTCFSQPVAMTTCSYQQVRTLMSCIFCFMVPKSTVDVPNKAALCLFLTHCVCCLVQANTELILGFESSAVTDELVARQQHLWQDWLDGLVSIPINLPGFSNAHPLTSQTAYSVLLIMATFLARCTNHLSIVRSCCYKAACHPLCH